MTNNAKELVIPVTNDELLDAVQKAMSYLIEGFRDNTCQHTPMDSCDGDCVEAVYANQAYYTLYKFVVANRGMLPFTVS